LSAPGWNQIFVWDHNWDAPDYPIEVLSDAAARRYIAGAAFHAYAGTPDAQEKVRRAFPDAEIHFTEISGGEWATDWGANLRWDVETLLVGAVGHGARTVLKWNLALDENHGPQNGGCTNCRGIVTIHSRTNAITRNEDYYALAHAARFVRPGARRVASSVMGGGPPLPNIAFRNPDSSRALIACNPDVKRPARLALRWRGQQATTTLPPGAVVTLTWTG
jgi:glucosylceramidase